MDFRDLISSNIPSTMSSNVSNVRVSFTGSQQAQLFNLLSRVVDLDAMGLPNPYMSEDAIRESLSYTDNIELIKLHYKELTNNTTFPDEKYLTTINHLWYVSPTGDFPTIDKVVDELFENRCDCTYAYDNQIIKNLLRHFFILGIRDTCNDIRIAMEFYMLNNSFPSVEEIENTAERMNDFYNNPEAFHQEDKVLIGVKGLEKLQVHTMDTNEFKSDDDLTCSICQEDINQGQNYIKLDCRHMYHFHSKDCLDESSIINWLEKNKFCPNCKCEVVVNKES